MADSTRTVLIDATPLRAGSGMRGIGRYIYELLQGLEETRNDWSDSLRLVALQNLSLTGKVELNEDLVAAADSALAQRGSVSNPDMRRRRQLWLGRAARVASADLLHETEALGTPLWCPVPRIVTCYDLVPLRYPFHYLDGGLRLPVQFAKDWRRYALARRVITISEQTRQDTIRILRVPAARVQAVITGIDLQRWASEPADRDDTELQKLGLGRRPFVLYVGFGDYRKNVEGMLAAVKLARQQADIELVWAGGMDAKQRRRADRKVRNAGLRDHVKFLGFVPDATLATLFRKSLAHLFMSRLEGFGLPVAEAMAVGCPVIVARRSGADEVAGDAGFVVEPDDAQAAADAILLLLRDPGERARRGEAGKRQVGLFHRRAMAAGYVDGYRRALAD